MPCKLPFSFCSVRHGAINGYLNKRLCPLLPAVTKTMLTGSQRSIHQQLGFNSGRPPSSRQSPCRYTLRIIYEVPTRPPISTRCSRNEPALILPHRECAGIGNRAFSPRQGLKLEFGKSSPPRRIVWADFLHICCVSFLFIYLIIVFYLLDLNLRISWSRDQLSVNTKTVRFWKKLLAGTERAH